MRMVVVSLTNVRDRMPPLNAHLALSWQATLATLVHHIIAIISLAWLLIRTDTVLFVKHFESRFINEVVL